MKNNIIEWKNGMVNNSKQLVLEIKNIYKEIKQFLTKPNFPDNDVNYYKTPLFDELTTIVSDVQKSVDINLKPITDIF